MSPDRWSRIEDLFQQATSVPPDQLSAFLDQACNGDDALRSELNSLLACDNPTSPLLNIKVPPVSFLKPPAPEPDPTGRRIGPYRVLRLIGRGGMGAVYLATRDDDQFRKEVAIKILKRGMDTDSMLVRFRQERQILANLEHPFIARLLDGGATEDGLPYIVMECVNGSPITKHCDDNNLSVPDRLAIFRLVCEAVHYAHRNLVVHRDLKPSNILITTEGVPKLLDFGIAKLLDQDKTDQATITQSEQRLLTPDYASPEQVLGLPISTSSDIYALGAILYELLSGSRPHRFTANTPSVIEKTICEIEPERPSAVVSRNADLSPRMQKQRSRQLAGDLDNAVLMAMRKEPSRRYESAAEFSEDIRRHLEGRPLVAQEDRWSYTAGKFIRRNRAFVLAAALLLATLVGGIAATSFQRGRSERRFQIVRELANTLLYDLHDQMERLPGSTALRASMVETVVHYLDSLADDSAGDPVLDFEIAKAYHRVAAIEGHPFRPNLGKTSAALTHYSKALEIDERLSSRGTADSEVIREHIAVIIESGDIQNLLGNPLGARAHFQKAAAIATSASARDPNHVPLGSQVYVYFRLGDEERNGGWADEAIPYYRKALDIAKQGAAQPSVATLRTLRGAEIRMANILFEAGQPAVARQHYDVARSLDEELLRKSEGASEDRWGEINTLHVLGDVLGNPDELHLGDPAGAQAMYRKALSLAENAAAADPNDVRARKALSFSHNRLGRMMLDSDPKTALEHYRQAYTSTAGLLRADESNIEYRRDVALAGLAMARCFRRLGNTGEALQLLNRSLDLQKPIESIAPQRIWTNRPLGAIYLEFANVFVDRRDSAGALLNISAALALTERLLSRAPASLYLQRDRAEALETSGKGYAAMARWPQVTVNQSTRWRADSCSSFEKARAIWLDFKRRNIVPPLATQREQQLRTALIPCRE